VKLRQGLASVLYEADRPRVKSRALAFGGIAINHRVQGWVVVHLELTVELETAAVMEHVRPKLRETGCQVIALLIQHGEAVAVALLVLRCGAVQLLGGVEYFEGEDRKTVDDQAGRFRVQHNGLLGLCRKAFEEGAVDLLHKVVAELVQAVNGALGGGQHGVVGGRVAGLVLAVPEVEVGAVLVQNKLLEGRGGLGCGRGGVVAVGGCESLEMDEMGGVEHGGDECRIAEPGRKCDTVGMTNGSTRRLLLYRLGSLGDMVVALPALHLVASTFPNAERRLLTNLPVSAKAAPAEAVLGGSGLVDGFLRYPVGTRSVWQLARLWWTLWRWRPEVVVYLAAARGVEAARRDARFFRLCGVRRLVGVPLTEAMQQNHYGSESADGDLEPEAARLVRCLAECGDMDVEEPANWDLRLSDAEREAAAEAIGGAALLSRPIAVSVGTKVQAKDWGNSNWRALLGMVAKQSPGRALLLVGAADEAEASEFAAEAWREQGGGPVVNLCGVLTPRESGAALATAELFLGHDSGPMHLAAAVGTRCVAVFAARNLPRQWFPVGRQHRVVYHRVDCAGCGLETCIEEGKKCLTGIGVEEVFEVVSAMIVREI